MYYISIYQRILYNPYIYINALQYKDDLQTYLLHRYRRIRTRIECVVSKRDSINSNIGYCIP